MTFLRRRVLSHQNVLGNEYKWNQLALFFNGGKLMNSDMTHVNSASEGSFVEGSSGEVARVEKGER